MRDRMASRRRRQEGAFESHLQRLAHAGGETQRATAMRETTSRLPRIAATPSFVTDVSLPSRRVGRCELFDLAVDDEDGHAENCEVTHVADSCANSAVGVANTNAHQVTLWLAGIDAATSSGADAQQACVAEKANPRRAGLGGPVDFDRYADEDASKLASSHVLSGAPFGEALHFDIADGDSDDGGLPSFLNVPLSPAPQHLLPTLPPAPPRRWQK